MLKYAIMFLAAGVIFLIITLAQWLQNRSYAACSERTTAVIDAKTKRHTKHGHVYELHAVYNVNGVEYKKWLAATATDYDTYSEGQSIEIAYKPHNPKKCIRPFQLEPKQVKVLFITTAVLIAIGAVLWLFDIFVK